MRHALTGWRLVGSTLAWLGGVAAQLQERTLLPGWTYVLVCAGAAGAVALVFALRSRAASGTLVLALGCAALGFGASGWNAASRLAEALPPALEGVDLQVTGVVASLPQRGPSGLRFRFEVEHATRIGPAEAADAIALPSLLSLGWYRGWHEDASLAQPQGALRAGQRWRLTLRLRQPHGTLNPHGYDHELALFEQGVRATGYVRDAPAAQLLGQGAGYPVERLRQRVRDAIDARVSDTRAAGVLAALAIGDQGAIERDDWGLFRDTGIAHLMSISGLHVTMFAWLAGLAITAVWRRSARAALWLPAPTAGRWGGLAAAALYAVFSGGGVPSQRTVWMLATVTLLASVGVRWPWGLVLLLAAVVVTAVDPWALLQPGFWLSFAAVGLLMVSGPPTTPTPPDAAARMSGVARRIGGVALGGLRTQAIATLGLTPLTLVFFQQVSLVGFVTNLIAIPLVTLVITPLALLGALLAPLWTLGAWVVQQGVAGLAWLASWPAAVWTVPVAPAWAQLAGLLAALLAMLPLPWRVRALALPLLPAMLWPQPPRPASGSFEMLALDVGQGSAVLVRTREHLLVYDTGPQYSRDADAGRRVLMPLLRARGERHIDTLVLSHRDSDHVGGARSVLAALPVTTLLTSLEPDHALRATQPGATTHTRCQAGQGWSWDGIRFEVLHPAAADYERSLKTNAMSCVLRISGAQASVLLTGDIEREQEQALLRSVDGGVALRSGVLLAPHHGSKTSSSDAFLAAVGPTDAVFQAGYRNRFGHPASEVLARYRVRGIARWTSPTCGAWQWRSDAPDRSICEREARRRYWHWRPSAGERAASTDTIPP
ncbi:MAG: DNA internalization-related competence protein ComEC/Rec2 [Burkholderiaceae bacterium]